jgi:UPF0716 family protein affecting phage T7 exclusion
MSRPSVGAVVGAGAVTAGVVELMPGLVTGVCGVVVVSVVTDVVVVDGSTAGRLSPHATAPSVQTNATSTFFMTILRALLAPRP